LPDTGNTNEVKTACTTASFPKTRKGQKQSGKRGGTPTKKVQNQETTEKTITVPKPTWQIQGDTPEGKEHLIKTKRRNGKKRNGSPNAQRKETGGSRKRGKTVFAPQNPTVVKNKKKNPKGQKKPKRRKSIHPTNVRKHKRSQKNGENHGSPPGKQVKNRPANLSKRGKEEKTKTFTR